MSAKLTCMLDDVVAQDIVSVGECSVSACHHTFHQHCISDHIKEQKYHVEQFNERLKEKRKQELAASKKQSSSKASSRTTKRKKQPAASSKATAEPANFYTSCPVCYQPLTLTTVRGAATTQKPDKKTKSADGAGVAEEELCVVCCEKRRDALLLDCGHMFTCNDCFNTMQKDTPKTKWTCPICRQKVCAPQNRDSFVPQLERLQVSMAW